MNKTLIAIGMLILPLIIASCNSMHSMDQAQNTKMETAMADRKSLETNP